MLKIANAQFVLKTHPAGATVEIHYRVIDEATPDMGRSGVLYVAASTALQMQLANFVEDELRAAGKL